jgi:hypothetical protein
MLWNDLIEASPLQHILPQWTLHGLITLINLIRFRSHLDLHFGHA